MGLAVRLAIVTPSGGRAAGPTRPPGALGWPRPSLWGSSIPVADGGTGLRTCLPFLRPRARPCGGSLRFPLLLQFRRSRASAGRLCP